jgi:YD repeat-containing protein
VRQARVSFLLPRLCAGDPRARIGVRRPLDAGRAFRAAVLQAAVWCAAVVGSAAVLGAQASDSGPAHAGSRNASPSRDTIYALAVDPAQHPAEDYVFLLDDGVVHIESDGRMQRTYRQVVQVLTQQGAAVWGERAFSYNSDRERLRVNWARVLRPDGSVVSAEPARQQESVAPVALAAPVYSAAKVVRITLAGVAPGTLVDYSYTRETKPSMPGEFEDTWLVTMGTLTRRSRYVVDVPTALEPHIKEVNLPFARRTWEADGRRTYEWATADIPRIDPEPYAADSNGVYEWIAVAAPIGWNDVAAWYGGLARDRYVLPAGLDTVLARVLASAPGRGDTLRALYRWVTQDFRYVSLDLGLGAYQPRPPAEVLATRYGDCKDKATLFIALARRFGFQADPVLLNLGGRVQRDLPALGAFNHVIARVEDTAGPLYLDLTSQVTRYGALPAGEPGRFALVVTADGRGTEITLPTDSARSRSETRLIGVVSPEGALQGTLTVVAPGAEFSAFRRAGARRLSPTERAQVANAIAGAVLPGATGDSLDGLDQPAATGELRLTLALRDERMLSSPEVLTLPFARARWPAAQVAAQLESGKQRRFPIDLDQILGAHDVTETLELTLPNGWRAHLPTNVAVKSPFGTYTVEYAQEGRTLEMRRRARGETGVVAPERVAEVIGWLRAAARDDADVVVLTRAP